MSASGMRVRSSGMLVRTTVRRGDFILDVELEIRAGETLALLGPNGSGKSTLLDVAAGLLRPHSGSVRLDGRLLTRVDAAGPAIHVPPDCRGVGLLGQEPLVFPHLSALENVAFGPRASGVSRRDAHETATRWLAAVGLYGWRSSRPSQLSGGQRQRIALARALAAEPDVLLLDEPFASLDVEAAATMRELVREHVSARGLTTVLVTHDAADAALLSDRVALLRDGHVEQHGSTAEVLAAPRNAFAAALVGAALLECTVDASGAVLLPGGRALDPREPLTPGSSVTVRYAPASIDVRPLPAHPVTGRATPEAGIEGRDDPVEVTSTERLSWSGTIASAIPVPGGIRLRLAEYPGLAADVAVTVAAGGLAPGSQARFTASGAAFAVVESGETDRCSSDAGEQFSDPV